MSDPDAWLMEERRMDVLYWEAHITIEPVFEERLLRLREITKSYAFRVADLLYQRDRKVTPLRSNVDTFTTGRGQEYQELRTRMEACVAALQAAGFQVWRKKIEAAVLDERL